MSSTEGSRPNALVFGEALWDLLPSGAVLGGAPLNFAYRLGSLGIPTRLVSQVGDDELGARTLQQMNALGMDTSLVSVTNRLPTATVAVELDENRQPSYTIVKDVAYDAVPWTEEVEAAAAGADILCFGTLAQRDQRSRRTLRGIVKAFTGDMVLVDINLRPECWNEETVRWSLENGTIVKLNDEELGVIAGIYGLDGHEIRKAGADGAEQSIAAVASELRNRIGLETLVVTRGAAGAIAVGHDGDPVMVPGYQVTVDDPCGAGDAFAGMFVASLVDGLTLAAAIERANALGALVATQPGATQPVAPHEVDELLNRGQQQHDDAIQKKDN